MIDVRSVDSGYEIEESMFLSDGDCKKDKINLALKRGEDVVFGKKDCFLIDYPGEYDKDNIFFRVYETGDGYLNYIIKKEDKKIVVVLSSDALEEEEIDGVDYWIYLDDEVSKKIDEREFEGEKISLQELS